MSRPFQVSLLKANTVAEICAAWKAIDFAPVYQRQSEIWSEPKQQLFIDSLINGYDIPKLYFHDLSWKEGGTKRYAIIDGKQRLEAIDAFINNRIALSTDFYDLELPDDHPRRHAAAGATYRELSKSLPAIKARFDSAELPIVLVQTDDREFIEEMFSRLNEAVPLNAPEKRNAIGGPLRRHIRKLAKNEFFTENVPFSNARYRHLDLATKFLYIEYSRGLTDLKKRDLDEFVRLFKKRNWVKKASALYARCTLLMGLARDVFEEPDDLLDSVGMITIYFELFRDAFDNRWIDEVARAKLAAFDQERKRNKALVREAQEAALEGEVSERAAEINDVLTQFERYVQSPNDRTALTKRYEVLKHYVRKGRIPSQQ